MAEVKVNDVFKDTQGRLWNVSAVKDGKATLIDPYAVNGDIILPSEIVPQFFTFCWNAVEEGWAGT